MPWDMSDVDTKDYALCGALLDMTAPMQLSTEIVAAGIEQNFDRESAAGNAWAELEDSTIEDRERRGYDGEHPILERTRRLREGASAFREATASSAEVGPAEGDRIAAYHLEGTSRMPARDFLVQSDRTEDVIEIAILDHLTHASG